jgi:hypothetical protein
VVDMLKTFPPAPIEPQLDLFCESVWAPENLCFTDYDWMDPLTGDLTTGGGLLELL